MKNKKQKTKRQPLSMSSEEMSFALFAFRKAYAHGHFVSICTRLNNTLQDMGVDMYGAEFDEVTEQYEKFFSNTMENQTK